MSENQQIYSKELFQLDYVQNRVLVSKYTALKQFLYSYLADAVSISTKNLELEGIQTRKIHLTKDRDKNRVLYVSGVGLWLLKSQNPKAMEFAQAIASHLSATCGDVFNIKIVPPGWIHLELTHRSLAAWLQSLVVGNCGEGEIRETKKDNQFPMPHAPCPMPNTLFAVQYAHARCCSLVLLAHREGLIKLQEPIPKSSPAFWSVISAQPLPWLNCDGTLRLNHPDEQRLIAQLVQVLDNVKCLDFQGYGNWQKAGLNLSQALEKFWCNCRIWGEVKITSPELAQARVGLVMATQSVLRLLLEEKLGVAAPLEL